MKLKISNITAVLKEFTEGRKFRMFLLFVLLSMVLWTITKLSKTYSGVIPFKVAYTNIPEDKLLFENEPQYIDLTIKSQGFRILSYKVFPKTMRVDASEARKGKNLSYVLVGNRQSAFKRQLPGDVQLEGISQDTLFLNLGINKKKKIPVTLDAEITFEKGYGLYEQIYLDPDTIEVSGPEYLVDSLSSLRTEKLLFSALDTSVDQEVNLLIEDSFKGLSFSSETSRLSFEVDKFTEVSYTVPIEMINAPNDLSIRLFPEEVNVSFKISLKDLKTASAEDFRVVCDYKEIEGGKKNYLTPIIMRSPKKVVSTQLLTPRIEYLIKR